MGPWVLESSYRYARASALLLDAGLMGESEVNAALSMELLLKSLLVVPVANARQGTVAEQYALPKGLVKDGHDLFQLYQAVPQHIADALNLHSQEELFRLKRHVFKLARYTYEDNHFDKSGDRVRSGGSDTLLLGTVSWLLPQLICYFVDNGATDKWLVYMRSRLECMRLDRLTQPA